MELTFEQKLQIQKLDMQIAALPIDKQQQFARGQRELVPKYLAKNAASGHNTTTTLTVVSFSFSCNRFIGEKYRSINFINRLK